jgi:hypothetical protein
MKTIKCKLKSILNPNYDFTFLHDAIGRANDAVFICSHFIRLFTLNQYKNGHEIPSINKDFIMMVFKTIGKDSAGPKSKQNIDMLNKLNSFYVNHMFKLINPLLTIVDDDNKDDDPTKITKNKINDFKLNTKNLSYILGSVATEMNTSYINNIQLNFTKYLCQFTNQSFKTVHDKLIEKCKTSKLKTEKRLELKRELRKVKDDLIFDTTNSNKKYHKWISKVKELILPEKNKNTLEDNIKYYPERFIKHMLYMNKYLEDNELKTFQPISLRTDVKDKYITLNTNALIDICPILEENKNNYLKNIVGRQKEVWDFLFELNKSKYKIKNYSFNYQIQTDGLAVSINFIHNDEIIKKNNKSRKMVEGSKLAKQNNKNKTADEIAEDKKKKKKDDIQKKQKISVKNKEIQKTKRAEFKKLSKDEQEKIKLKMKLQNDEFNYVEDLVKMDCFLSKLKSSYSNNNIAYVDPGKRSPLTMLRNDGKTFEYRTKNRLRETKRLKYNKLILNKKKKTMLTEDNKNIVNYELKLSEYSGKSIDFNKFIEYTKIKLDMRKNVSKEKKYNEYLKKLSWFAYINTKKHESLLMNKIENFFGKDVMLILGDWGGKGNISYISTPQIGLQRKLKTRFQVYHINEYNTSKIHHKTKEVCGNLYLPLKSKDKDGNKITQMKKMYPILTYKMSNGGLGCINRDLNATRNMKIIVESLIDTKTRPKEYTRTK